MAEHVLHPDQFPVLYHGTHRAEDAQSIRIHGMRPANSNVIFPARWPTLTTSRDQALRYGPHVVEVKLPPELAEQHLWPELEHTAYGYDAKAYAVKQHIPPGFVR